MEWSQSAVDSIYKKWSKEGTMVNQWQGQGLLMHVVSKGFLCGRLKQMSNCGSNCLKVKARSDRKVWEITVDWGCIAAARSGCPCDRTPLLKAPTMGASHVSIRTGPWGTGRRWPTLMNHVFFYIFWLARCMCVTYLGNTWHQDALLGNLGSCHLCGRYFDT